MRLGSLSLSSIREDIFEATPYRPKIPQSLVRQFKHVFGKLNFSFLPLSLSTQNKTVERHPWFLSKD
jgi:hypothetical protein